MIWCLETKIANILHNTLAINCNPHMLVTDCQVKQSTILNGNGNGKKTQIAGYEMKEFRKQKLFSVLPVQIFENNNRNENKMIVL